MVRQAGGKRVHAWGLSGELDADRICSNLVQLEWPPGSSRPTAVPEVDRAAWVDLGTARRLLNPAQAAFVDRLAERLGWMPDRPGPRASP